MTVPKIKTTLVGSYPYPAWLAAMPSEQALTDAMRVVLHTQERAGIDYVVDGELYRFDVNHPETNGMFDYFLRPMAGFRPEVAYDEILEFKKTYSGLWKKPVGVVDGPVGSGTLNLPEACARARELTDRPLKFTITGPHMLARLPVNKHYPDRAALADAIADVLAQQVEGCDADIIQMDEASLPVLPDDWPYAAKAINKVLDAARGMTAVHLCLGNYNGQRSPGASSWDRLLDYLNALHADHVVLENAYRPLHEIEVFKDLRPDLGLGLGVIDIKSNEIETPDAIAARLEEAARVLGPDRLRFIHPDCGFFMLNRSVVDAKIKALVAGRDLYEGR